MGTERPKTVTETPETPDVTYYAMGAYQIIVTPGERQIQGNTRMLDPAKLKVVFKLTGKKGPNTTPYSFRLDKRDANYWPIRHAIEGRWDPDANNGEGDWARKPSPDWERGRIWSDVKLRLNEFADNMKDPITRDSLIHMLASVTGQSYADLHRRFDTERVLNREIRAQLEEQRASQNDARKEKAAA